MRCMSVAVVITLVAILMGWGAWRADATIEGIQMVGIGLPPDSVEPDDGTSHCDTTSSHTTELEFFLRETEDDDINRDIDLLVSETLTGQFVVTAGEVDLLLQTLDADTINAFSVGETDLQLVFNYLSYSDGYDEATGFEVFPACTTLTASQYRNDIDLYLVKHGDDETGGHYPSNHMSRREDEPRESAGAEFHKNSFHVTDARGNATADTTDWPRKVAQGAAHEFGHLLWRSNAATFGARSTLMDFNELNSAVAGYVVKALRGSIGSIDRGYAQSLAYLMGGPFAGCSAPGSTVNDCADWAELDDCMGGGYTTRAMFVAYLMEHFHGDQDYTEDLLYRWTRARENGTGVLTRDLCGLARVLDDDDYSSLGGTGAHPGEHRLKRIFHNYSIAKALDDTTISDYYSFGDSQSPVSDYGLFLKLDSEPEEDSIDCYENAVPPQFFVGQESDGVWRHVPGNASDQRATGCDYGWNDPADSLFCDDSYCDSVKVRLWGSNYIAFKADTTYYNSQKSNRYLQIRLEWSAAAMHDSTELWAKLIKYSRATVHKEFFRLGRFAVNGGEQVYGVGDTFAVINVPEFHEGGNEIAAVILSLVPTTFDTVRLECRPFEHFSYCFPRRASEATDLTYSYKFKVLQEPSTGCPVVRSWVGGEYQADNNVLPGAVFGSDIIHPCSVTCRESEVVVIMTVF